MSAVTGFGLLHPAIFLAALGLAVLPLLLELWPRPSARPVVWAATRFFLTSGETIRRRRIRRWLLVALRMAIILLAGLLLARPQFPWAQPWPIIEPRSTVIIVLDASTSMQVTDAEGRSAWQQAKGIAARLITAIRGQQRAGLLIVGSRTGRTLIAPTTQRDELLQALHEVRLTGGHSDLTAALALAEQTLATHRRPNDQQGIVVLSDNTAVAWSGVAGASPSAAEAVVVIDCGPAERENFAITDLRLVHRLTDLPLAEFQLHHYRPAPPPDLSPRRLPAHTFSGELPSGQLGQEAAAGMGVQLLLNGRVVHQQPLAELPPGAPLSFSVPLALADAPQGVLEARLYPPTRDVLPADDRRWVAVDCRTRLEIWLCGGGPAGPFLPAETTFLDAAVGGLAETIERPAIHVHAVWADELLGIPPDQRDLIVLANCPANPPLWTTIDQMVRDGAVAWFFVGPRTDLAEHGQLAGEFCGVDFDRWVQADPPVHFQLPAFEGGLFDHAGAEADFSLFAADVRRYARVTPRAGARVLLAYDDGSPGIVARQRGEGGTIFCTTSAETEWNDLPIYGDFVSLLGLLLEHSLEMTASARKGRLDEGPAVNVPAVESDLRPIDAGALADRLAPRQVELLVPERFQPRRDLPARGEATRMVWLMLVICWLAEIILSSRFAR